VSDLLISGQIVSVALLIAMELMLWFQVRKLNKNFALLFAKVDNLFDQIKPMLNALNKATPFLEVFNAITGLFRKKRREK